MDDPELTEEKAWNLMILGCMTLAISSVCSILMLLYVFRGGNYSQEHSLSEVFVRPSTVPLLISIISAIGVGKYWPGHAAAIGAVAAIPYVLFALSNGKEWALFWSASGIITFLIYFGAVIVVRRSQRIRRLAYQQDLEIK